jgi:hypothetical protein
MDVLGRPTGGIMKKPGTLKYRCRRCGEENNSWHVPDLPLALMHIINGNPLPEDWGPANPKLLTTHSCKDGHQGIADIIGGTIDP